MVWGCACLEPFASPGTGPSKPLRREQVVACDQQQAGHLIRADAALPPKLQQDTSGFEARPMMQRMPSKEKPWSLKAEVVIAEKLFAGLEEVCSGREGESTAGIDQTDQAAAAAAGLEVCRQRREELERMCSNLKSQNRRNSEAKIEPDAKAMSCPLLQKKQHSADSGSKTEVQQEVATRGQADTEQAASGDAALSVALLPQDACEPPRAVCTMLPAGAVSGMLPAEPQTSKAVIEFELDSTAAMVRQWSSDSLASSEQILSLDQCGSLVIVGRDIGERSSDDEDGWRMQELLGNRAVAATPKSRSKPSKSWKSGNSCEDGWRWDEMLGMASVSGTAATLQLDSADGPTAVGDEQQRSKSLPPPAKPPDIQKKRRRRRGSTGRRKGAKQHGGGQHKLEVPEEDVESGWRWQEMSGMAEPDKSTKKVKQHAQSHDCERSWRWQECAWSPRVVTALPTTLTSASTDASTATDTFTGDASAVTDTADAVDTDIVITEPTLVADGLPHVGDIVVLGAGAPVEYRDCPAAVVEVFVSHCSVIVLDGDQRFGIGECWPNFEDVMVESSTLRLGTRVVIDGMRGKRTQRFNGHSGTIRPHPREGHPVLIRKPSCPDSPQLTVCVCFDNPQETGEKSALIEPRFLFRYDEAVRRATKCLGDVLATLGAISEEGVKNDPQI